MPHSVTLRDIFSPKPSNKMENFDQPIDAGMGGSQADGLRITPQVREYWRQTLPWTLFLAILLFILFGLVSLLGLMAAFAGGAAGLVSGIFAIAIYGVFLFLPGLYYYRFSTQMKQALNTEDTTLLDQAFHNLKLFYRFVGILTIVAISLVILVFLVSGAALLNQASGLN